ncbi:MAG: DinB family protein [Acidobacteriota bacterium]
MLPRPDRSDCHDFYFTYIGKVPEGDVLECLRSTLEETRDLLRTVSPEQETFAYAPEKWSVRELVGHMIDAERLFGFRAFWFARGAPEPLPGMDEKEFAAVSNAGKRPLGELLEEFSLLRRQHLALFAGFDADAWERSGVASGWSVRVGALPFIMAGHEIHHLGVLRERYLL